MASSPPSRILVVDDQPAALYATSRVLRAAGFDVVEASSGTEAVRLATTQPMDLVVLDVNLPDITGFAACQQIRMLRTTPRMPVIYLSATFVDDVHKVRGYEAGADGYLTHPVEPSVLVATVNAFLRARAIELEREALLASERAARAEAERANRVKDEFLATLSHELRSPLSAIIGWAEVARTLCRDMPQVLEALAVIVRNARFQARLVSDLLDVTRITSGKLRLEMEDVDVVQVINSALEGAQSSAAAKGVEIEGTLDAQAGTIRGDQARVQQIVSNLLDNAVKFSSRGGRVTLRLSLSEDAVEIVVADEGRGISPERLPHVFDRFWQEDTSSRRSHSGLGLGLAIVKHLVELHGGTVRAESAGEGRGATFTVRLPRISGLQSPAAPREAPRLREEVADELRGVRILVVDDDADARRWVRQVLASVDADVMEAADAAQAIEAVSRFDPQLLISDLAMPLQDGFDLLAYLRSAGWTNLPALALTAFASHEDKHRALSAGFHGFLAKPVEPADLLDSLAHLFSRARNG